MTAKDDVKGNRRRLSNEEELEFKRGVTVTFVKEVYNSMRRGERRRLKHAKK